MKQLLILSIVVLCFVGCKNRKEVKEEKPSRLIAVTQMPTIRQGYRIVFEYDSLGRVSSFDDAKVTYFADSLITISSEKGMPMYPNVKSIDMHMADNKIAALSYLIYDMSGTPVSKKDVTYSYHGDSIVSENTVADLTKGDTIKLCRTFIIKDGELLKCNMKMPNDTIPYDVDIEYRVKLNCNNRYALAFCLPEQFIEDIPVYMLGGWDLQRIPTGFLNFNNNDPLARFFVNRKYSMQEERLDSSMTFIEEGLSLNTRFEYE